jgi:hypothetical protein
VRIVFGEPGDERCAHVVVGVGPEGKAERHRPVPARSIIAAAIFCGSLGKLKVPLVIARRTSPAGVFSYSAMTGAVSTA